MSYDMSNIKVVPASAARDTGSVVLNSYSWAAVQIDFSTFVANYTLIVSGLTGETSSLANHIQKGT